jgi:beta-glucosidase
VFAFGHGLSYTTFSYAWTNTTSEIIKASAADLLAITDGAATLSHLPANEEVDDFISFEVNVTNTGKVDADDSVLCFVEAPGAGTEGTPIQSLAAFRRVHIAAGETQTIVFGASARHFILADEDGAPSVVTGDWTLRMGVKDANYLSLGGTAPIKRTVRIA